MANLKEIKMRIASVQKTQQITKAMKMVAASRMKKATDRIIAARPYAKKLHNIIQHLEDTELTFGNQYLEERELKRVLLVVIAADRGLCGSFNTNIRKKAIQTINEYKNNGIDVSLITVGKKSVEFCRKFNVDIEKEFLDVFRSLDFNTAEQVIEESKKMFLKEKVDRVELIYNEYQSVVSQIAVVDQIMPIRKEEKNNADKSDYIYEPSKVELLSTLLPKYLNYHMWKALLESNASEQASKMMAMDNATNNAGDLIKKLNLTYNKIRQASITTQISEIVGGSEALKG
jgi:F-type H+-transporting ATPase subunit gamma